MADLDPRISATPIDDKGTDGLVSIITPAYRAAALIGDTIQSAIAQTYLNWEMLIVDDCSPDNTADVVSEWSQRDSRVKLIRHERNGGPATARNTALSAANGRWIAFLDSDDIWLPEKLSMTLAHAQANSSPLTFTGFRRITFSADTVGRYIGVPRTVTYHQLLRNTVIATSTVLIDRSKVDRIVMKKTYYDDFACWLEILKPGRVAFGLNEDLLRYRVVQNSVSRNKKNSAAQVWKSYREIEKLSTPKSIWYFTNYAMNGLFKYRKF